MALRARRSIMRALAAAVVVAAGVTGPLAATGEARGRYHVAYHATVSGPVDLPSDCHARNAELFPQLVTHPGSPRLLTAVYFQDGQQAAVGARSRSAGHRWTRTPIASATSCTGGPAEREQLVNPLLAGGRRVAYYGNSWYGSRDGFFAFDVAVHRSTRSAGAWSRGAAPNLGSAMVLPGGPYAQNVAVAADRRNPDVVQAIWTRFDQVPNPATYIPVGTRVEASASVDRGQTFTDPVTVSVPPSDEYVINARLHQTSDGGLLALYDTVPKAALAQLAISPDQPIGLEAFASRSTDGGQTWSAPARAGEPVQFAFTDPDGGDRFYGSPKFDAATGTKRRAVIAWATPREGGVAMIELARSIDGGASWSEPSVAVSVGAHMIQPAVALDREGRTGLFWYDTRNDEPNDGELTADAWFASSNRAGREWQVRHLAGPFDLRASYDSNVVAYDGDQGIGVYQDVVAMRRGFGVAYTIGVPLARDGVSDVQFTRLID